MTHAAKPQSSASEGFVYVATGQSYRDEARRSAVGLRRYNPGRPICLVTDREEGERIWDDVVVLDTPRFGFRDKLEMRRCPYDRFVFLDTDTHVAGDMGELFTILRNFDACGVQLFEGQDYSMDSIPHAFPEMNGGMLGFKAGPLVDEFFELWAKFYDEFKELNRDGNYAYENVGDQKSLRAALWHSRLRYAAAGPEFNFIPFRMEFASLPVKVLHTRATAGIDGLFARMNARLGRRAYVPLMDAVVSNDPSPSEMRKLALSSARQVLRHSLRQLVPRVLRDALRRSSRMRLWFLGSRYEVPAAAHDKKWERPKANPRP